MSATHAGFFLDRPSKTRGYLATFGTHPDNDIVLPPDPSLLDRHSNARACNTRTRHAENYHSFHFNFRLADSGELILRDLSPCLTTIEVSDASLEEADRYQLHGQSPRQRVIPRARRHVDVVFGRATVFALIWNPAMIEDNSTLAQGSLVQHARQLATTGVVFSGPDDPSIARPGPFEPRRSDRVLRSRYNPSVQPQGFAKPAKSCHYYRKLGSGTYGVVWKVVDLASGEL